MQAWCFLCLFAPQADALDVSFPVTSGHQASSPMQPTTPPCKGECTCSARGTLEAVCAKSGRVSPATSLVSLLPSHCRRSGPGALSPPPPSPDGTSLCPAGLKLSPAARTAELRAHPSLYPRVGKASEEQQGRGETDCSPLPSPACCWGRARANRLSINACNLDRGPRVLYGRRSPRGGGARRGRA